MLRHEIEDGELDNEDEVIPTSKYSNILRNGPHSDSDSDDDFPHRIIEKQKNIDAKNIISKVEENMEIPVKRRRCKTKNNIWSNVVADQMLSSDMTNWSGVENTHVRNRDVESYDFSKAKDDSRPECLYQEMLYSDKMIKEISEEHFDPDSIETFGTSNMGPKGIKRRLGNQVVKGIKERLGERTFDKTKERMHINVADDSAAEVVVDELLRLLTEPEHMKPTFQSIVSTIGVPKSLELLKITEDIEEAGGILTLDNTRRRSPGGVYLYLLKSKTTTEEQKLIFQINYNDQPKKKVRNRRRISSKRTWELPQDKGIESDNIIKEKPNDDKIQDLVEKSQKFIADTNEKFNGHKNIDCYDDKDMALNVTVHDNQRLVNKLDSMDKSTDKINDSMDIELDFI